MRCTDATRRRGRSVDRGDAQGGSAAAPPGEARAMRALFTSSPIASHLHPLLPIARALADAGHEVAVAAPAPLADAVARAGLRHLPAGLERDVYEVYPALRTMPDGPARVAFAQGEVFASLWPRLMLPDLLALAATWPPD